MQKDGFHEWNIDVEDIIKKFVFEVVVANGANLLFPG